MLTAYLLKLDIYKMYINKCTLTCVYVCIYKGTWIEYLHSLNMVVTGISRYLLRSNIDILFESKITKRTTNICVFERNHSLNIIFKWYNFYPKKDLLFVRYLKQTKNRRISQLFLISNIWSFSLLRTWLLSFR